MSALIGSGSELSGKSVAMCQKQTCHTSIPRLLTEAEFTMRYMMLIHHDEVALAAAIALGRLRGGQGELKYRTARFIRLCPQPAPMGVYDRPANRQPIPVPLGFVV